MISFGVYEKNIKTNKEQFLESQKFLETLEDHDDVQKVYSNIEMLE